MKIDDTINIFRNYYKPLLKDRYDEFEYNLKIIKKKSFRINKSRNIDYLNNELKDLFTLTQHKYIDNLFTVEAELSDKTISNTLSHKTGGIYIMNISSVITAKILSSFLPDNPIILDISAAPGGKTTAISDYIGRKGIIIANEISSSRLKSLHFNLEKNGCYNVLTTSIDGRLVNKFFDSSMDAVLLDAPCSNENKLFRDKVVRKNWSEKLIARMAKLQKELIRSAFYTLKEGGVMLYSTCTLNIEENEQVVQYLLSTEDQSELININQQNIYQHGLLGDSYIDSCIARVMPTETIDGFFIAVIRKKGELRSDCNKKEINFTSAQQSFINDYFNSNFPTDINILEVEGRGYIKSGTVLENRVNTRYNRRGLNLYKIAKTNLELQSQSLWEFGQYIHPERVVNISYPEAEEYLKGFDLNITTNYNKTCLFYLNMPIGVVKPVDSISKNKLDRYFLYSQNKS